MERSCVPVSLREDVLKIDALHTRPFDRPDILVVRLCRDVAAAVPLLVALAHHGQRHARLGTYVQLVYRDVHLHREEFRRAVFGYGEHHRHMGTSRGGVVLVQTAVQCRADP